MSEPIQAFRTITIPIDVGDGAVENVAVDINLDLLEKFEDALQKCQDWGWRTFRLKKSEKSILDAYREFAEPYLPRFIDPTECDPSFFILFFSSVRKVLVDSIEKSNASSESTEK